MVTAPQLAVGQRQGAPDSAFPTCQENFLPDMLLVKIVHTAKGVCIRLTAGESYPEGATAVGPRGKKDQGTH